MKEKDEALVTAFRNMLKEAGIPYKCSQEPINNTVSEFEDIIGRGTIVVIFYSPDYFKSPHCMNEYALARKNEVHNNIFTVRCYKFVYNDIFRDLVRFWSAEEGDFRLITTNHTKVQEASKSHDFYLQPTHPYSIHNLSSFFPDNPYYTEKNLDVLFEKVKEKYYELAGKSKGSNIPAKSLKSLPSALLDNIDNKHFVPRDTDIEKIHKSFLKNKIVNVVGIGGCGKSTISLLYLQKYRNQFSHITDIIINGDVYSEFCEMFVEIHPICEWVDSDKTKGKHDVEKTFHDIINQLCKYSPEDGKTNLFVLDVNETADENDYAKVRAAIATFEKHCVANQWKLLVLSRVPLCDKLASTYNKPNGYIDISRVDQIDFKFIKELFFDTLEKKQNYYKTFKDEELQAIFSKLGNLPVLIKALAEFLDGDETPEQSHQQIMSLLGDGDLNNDLKGLDCTSINKPIVYDKIGNFLSKLCRFSTLGNEIQKNIVRHMMLWDADYYSVDLIQRLVLGESNNLDIGFTNSLRILEHKCWLDSRSDKSKIQYKMHSLIANNCFNQINNPNKIVFDEYGNQVEVPNPDYEANEKYRDYASYFNNVCSVICEGNLSSETETCIKNIDTIYLPWLKIQPHPDLPFDLMDENGFIYINIPIGNYGEIKMMKVHGGSYMMGNMEENSASPMHRVSIATFYISETQVTQELWDKIMKDTKIKNLSEFQYGGRYPVENVSWYECIAFIMKLNDITGMCFRLPTEAEWEYAARSEGKNFEYSWNIEAERELLRNGIFVMSKEEKLKEFAWFERNSNHKTHPVATGVFPNELGIYDMTGNVSEWCSDWYAADYYQKCTDDIDLSNNPQGPISGSSRVNRGGNWANYAEHCRVSSRVWDYPGSRVNSVGFRLSLSCLRKTKNRNLR
ncbi:MAG: SUMF1/EgtB/PvdO family nonheme iron enzyme [Bacteroidales bacterium]|nr:SUMF1/EgtB/PvdO family nonheme iron enzyme [Bacteroidales bacterium]